MEQPFGTFKNNTVSEHFWEMRFRYLTPSLCTPKIMTVLEHFQKIRFCYLTPPLPTAPQNDTYYLIMEHHKTPSFLEYNLMEPFRIILFRKVSERYAFVTYSLPLHPKNDCFGTFPNDTLSLPYSPPTAPQKWHSLAYKPNIWTFQKDNAFVTLLLPPPLHPKMTLTISLWNIIKPHPFWHNNLLEPFRIILFRKVSERYAFVTYSLSLHPKNDCFGTFPSDTLSLPYSHPPTAPQKWHSLAYKPTIWMFRKDNAFVTLLLPPPLHPKNDTCYLINRTAERFRKIPFRYLTPPPAPQNYPRYLIDRTSERFGKIRFLYLTPPPHCTQRMTLVISYIEHHKTPPYMEQPFGTFKNNTVSEHFKKMCFRYLTPSLCTPKMMTVLEHFRKIRFCYLNHAYSPLPTAPQNDTHYLIIEHHKTPSFLE